MQEQSVSRYLHAFFSFPFLSFFLSVSLCLSVSVSVSLCICSSCHRLLVSVYIFRMENNEYFNLWSIDSMSPSSSVIGHNPPPPPPPPPPLIYSIQSNLILIRDVEPACIYSWNADYEYMWTSSKCLEA